MAEPEELISDAARHATIFARNLWRRHRLPAREPVAIALADVAPRIDLLITAIFGVSYPLRTAQLPARVTMLTHLFRRNSLPGNSRAIPATDGIRLWLPADLQLTDRMHALQRYRIMALQQAMRAHRGSASLIDDHWSQVLADVYLLLEAHAADTALAALLPGVRHELDLERRNALAARPPLSAFSRDRRPLERFARRLMSGEYEPVGAPFAASPAQSLLHARRIIESLARAGPLFKDCWTGELRMPYAQDTPLSAIDSRTEEEDAPLPRSARLTRRPEVRKPRDGEDDGANQPGPWMIQADEPHMHAEDPMGLQRPVDRDESIGADEYGELLSELSGARLVATPGRPREVLLSDDPPAATARYAVQDGFRDDARIRYPEWDYRIQAYREPGATVRVLPTHAGERKWMDATLAEHRAMLDSIRRRFEMLRARRVTLRRRCDGDEIDLEAFIEGHADFRAGGPMPEALYRMRRCLDRDMAITLLIDVSGSTDGWIAAGRRVIDVEREALLLVCIALEGMGEPYSVLAFSGEGPQAVSVRQIKRFDERYGDDVALRIGALEPERYTRAGAAIRHATAQLMRESAPHRLLLLLSDGKPNDVDEYEGRYGVEDMRQAVIEARLQGIFPFCLTIDRQAAGYLPRIFGANQYALLPKPELLPAVLLDWMRRLASA